MFSQVITYIKTHHLFSGGEKIVVAVSGGPDSMALLHILWKLSEDRGPTLIAAHLHHGLRTQADQDLELVQKQCTAWGIQLEEKRLDVAQLARSDKRSVEEMGRICRYDFFREVLQKHQADCIATAHHQEDNAESVLLHLLRGSGTQGLRGILPINNNIVRPLLGVKKAQILEYLIDNQVPYRVDLSNTDMGFTRNRIRHELIPYLKEHYNPQLINGLNQLADIILQEDDWLQMLITELWAKVVKEDQGSLVLELPSFYQAHPAAQRRLILSICRHLTGSLNWEKRDIDSIIRLGQSPGSAHYLGLKQHLMVYKVYQQLRFTTLRRRSAAFHYDFVAPGEITIEATGELVSCSVVARADLTKSDRDTILDWEKLDHPLQLRSRMPGDRFTPIGAHSSQKLKKYYIDRKIPWEERERIPLLASPQGKIYALIGQAVDKDAQVSSQSQYILVIKRERLKAEQFNPDSTGE